MKKYIILLIFLLSTPVYAGSITTSGVTAQTIIDRVRNDLNETTASFWTNTDLLQWINEAVNTINSRTRCLESGVSNVIVVENTRSYSITSSFLDIEKVEYDIGLSGNTTQKSQIYDLERVPFFNLRYGVEKERGDPKTYSVWNNTLYVFPIPGSTQAGNTIYLYAVTAPSGVTVTTSQIETPKYFDDAILLYVKSKALSKDKQDGKADAYMKLFDAYCDRYRVDVMRRELLSTGAK